jgi:hypothetical protein
MSCARCYIHAPRRVLHFYLYWRVLKLRGYTAPLSCPRFFPRAKGSRVSSLATSESLCRLLCDCFQPKESNHAGSIQAHRSGEREEGVRTAPGDRRRESRGRTQAGPSVDDAGAPRVARQAGLFERADLGAAAREGIPDRAEYAQGLPSSAETSQGGHEAGGDNVCSGVPDGHPHGPRRGGSQPARGQHWASRQERSGQRAVRRRGCGNAPCRSGAAVG